MHTRKSLDQRALTDTGLAADQDDATLTSDGAFERRVELGQFGVTLEQVRRIRRQRTRARTRRIGERR
jgi:hypothetical protein